MYPLIMFQTTFSNTNHLQKKIYMHRELNDRIYMHQPEGFIYKDKRILCVLIEDVIV